MLVNLFIFLTSIPQPIFDLMTISPIIAILCIVIYYLYRQMEFYRNLYINENKENKQIQIENMQIIDKLTVIIDTVQNSLSKIIDNK
jgi:hypothetical protein